MSKKKPNRKHYVAELVSYVGDDTSLLVDDQEDASMWVIVSVNTETVAAEIDCEYPSYAAAKEIVDDIDERLGVSDLPIVY